MGPTLVDMSDYGQRTPDYIYREQYLFGLDPTTAYGVYGAISFLLASGFPLLWLILQKDLAEFNSIGYKFNAYLHLYGYGPFAFFWLFSYVFYNSGAFEIAYWASQITLFGPYGFQIWACVQIFMYGTDQRTPMQWTIASLYIVYTLGMGFLQYAFMPALRAYYVNFKLMDDYRRTGPQNYMDAQGTVDTRDLSYLGIDKSFFPDEEDEANLSDWLREQIENDPRPPTAKDYLKQFEDEADF